MKILHISNYYPERDTGASGTIMAIGEAMIAAGQQVTFAWRQVPLSWWGHNFSRFFDVPARQLRQARTLPTQAEYDVVIVHQPHGYRIFEKLAPLYPRTVFLNLSHGWEPCVPSFSPPQPSLARRLKDQLSTALVLKQCQSVVRSADGIVVLNRLDADYIITRQGGSAEKVCVLTLGLDPEILKSPVRAPAPANQPVRLLFIGSYVAQKGVDMLEAALVELNRSGTNFTYTCVTHRDKHAALLQRLGPVLGNRLRLLDWRPRKELLQLYRDHDFLLFPSNYEGFGKVAHEAMACGLAVVGTRVGVLADHADHGENALLSEPGAVAGFLTNLKQAVANPTLANTLGQRARAAVANDTWDRVPACFIEFIEQCRTRKTSPAS